MKSILYSSLKLLAIIIFIVTIVPSIISILLILYEPYENVADTKSTLILMWFFQIGFYLVISISLWFLADKLSSLIILKQKPDEIINIDSNKILEIGFIIIGVYFLVSQLPNLVSQIYSYFFESDSNYFTAVKAKSLKGIIISLFSTLISFYLIIGREKILLKIKSLRSIS